MEHAQFIEYKGIKIFVLDFSDCQPSERYDLIEECARQVQSQPKKSVYAVTVATGSHFDAAFVDKLKLLAKGNEPHVIKSAVVGLSGLQQIAMMIISSFSGKTFEQFDSVEKAKEFFVADSLGRKG
ncbi:MAG: hypothetical protein PHD54_12045 [Desulfuromonadaceae bacterium]|nr:hypothetical protein [Desulfuromonadaceae bacterium]